MSAPPTTIRPPSIRALTGEHFAARPDTVYFSQQALRLFYSTHSSGFEAEYAGLLYGDTFQVRGGECRIVCLASQISRGSGVSVTITPEAFKEDSKIAYVQLRQMGIPAVNFIGGVAQPPSKLSGTVSGRPGHYKNNVRDVPRHDRLSLCRRL